MGYFNCAPISSFPLSMGKRIIIKKEYKKGARGKIVDFIATQTYGIELDDGEYVTLWDCDVMPEMNPEDAYYYGQDCLKAYLKRLSFIDRIKYLWKVEPKQEG